MPLYVAHVEAKNVDTTLLTAEEKERISDEWFEFTFADDPDLAAFKFAERLHALKKKNPAAFAVSEFDILVFAEAEEEPCPSSATK